MEGDYHGLSVSPERITLSSCFCAGRFLSGDAAFTNLCAGALGDRTRLPKPLCEVFRAFGFLGRNKGELSAARLSWEYSREFCVLGESGVPCERSKTRVFSVTRGSLARPSERLRCFGRRCRESLEREEKRLGDTLMAVFCGVRSL